MSKNQFGQSKLSADGIDPSTSLRMKAIARSYCEQAQTTAALRSGTKHCTTRGVFCGVR
jgi:hypothetical protein